MLIAHSTRLLRPRDRIPYWVEVATREFYRHEFRSRVGRSFLGELQSGPVGQLWVGRCKCDPCDVWRDKRDIARDDVDDILLSVRRSGKTLISQGGRELAVDTRTMLLLDTRQPSKISFRSPSDFVVLMIPRAALTARLGELSEAVARPIPVGAPVCGLAAGFITALAERLGDLDEASCSKLCELTLDLVALAFSIEMKKPAMSLSGPGEIALMRLKAAIEARLCDPNLKPAMAAADAGVSVRHANKLLSQEGSSIERYILHRRLERCRLALEDAAQNSRLIGDIAFSWGFSDLSHFVRRFRAAYGMTPGDWRRRAKMLASMPE